MKDIFNEYGIVLSEMIGGAIGISILFATFIGTSSPASNLLSIILKGLM